MWSIRFSPPDYGILFFSHPVPAEYHLSLLSFSTLNTFLHNELEGFCELAGIIAHEATDSVRHSSLFIDKVHSYID